MPSTRPGPLRWLAYAYGLGLPERYREWVLHDVTARSWLWRHLSRFLVQIAPIVILIMVFLPASWPLRLGTVLAGTALALIFSYAYVVETGEHRLVKAGYPAGTGQAIRKEETRRRDTEARQARRERIAARHERRLRR